MTSILLPWETFAEQAERERRERETGERWTDELLADVRSHVLDYASQLTGDYKADIVPRHLLYETWRLLPYHFRAEVFGDVPHGWRNHG